MGLIEKLNQALIRRGLIVTTALATSFLYADNLQSKGEGVIYGVDANDNGITVKGESSDDSDWLGCTIYFSTGSGRDRPAVEVSGNFERSFFSSNTGRTYTVALWDRRVNKEYCDGEGTDEVPGPKCKENEYHLEGELDRKSGYISHVIY